MGPVRGGLILSLAGGRAWSETCERVQPGWSPGTPVTAWQETLNLFSSPVSLALLLGTALALRLRSHWGALAAVVGWSVWVTLVSMADPTGIREMAGAEGCVGSPALFIALVAAICVGTILYTAPLKRRD